MSQSLRLDLPRRGRMESGVVPLLAVLIAGFIFFYASNSVEAAYSAESGCVVSDPYTFDRLLESGGTLAVMFSSDTCPVCKAMEPSWLRLCKSPPGNVRVVILKLTRSTIEVFNRYAVTETPTFIVFVGGEPAARHVGAFEGGNITQAMLDWVLEATRPVGAQDLRLIEEKCSSCHSVPRGLDAASLRDWVQASANDTLARAVATAAGSGVTLSEMYGGRWHLAAIIRNMTPGISTDEAYRAAMVLDEISLTLSGQPANASAGEGGASTPLNLGSTAFIFAGPLAALLAGLIAALSPCVFPLLVSYTTSLASNPRSGLGAGASLKAFAFAAAGALGVGALFMLAGEAVAEASELLLPTAALVLIAAGLLEFLRVPTFINVNVKSERSLTSFTLLYGVLAVQCSFPLVAGAMLLVASGGLDSGLPALAGFALGISAPVGLAVWASSTGRLKGLVLRVSGESFRRYTSLALSLSGVFLLAYSIGLV